MSLAELLDQKDITNYVQEQYKKIKKNKNTINSKRILVCLYNNIKDIYSVTKNTEDELIIKFDKKKSPEELIYEFKAIIDNIIQHEISVDLLFKFIKNTNEIIIRIKRNV